MLRARLRPLLLILFAAGCSSRNAVTPPAPAPAPSTPTGVSRDPEAPQQLGGRELRVGASGDYAPFSTQHQGGVPTGFDADLAQFLARDLGLEVRWVPFRWPELTERLVRGEFDVAMSGVTWQPTRAVTGYMTRAVAYGGPCVLGDANARQVAVNRGGILEAWARKTLADREITTVDDNLSLPALLEHGRVGAIVTDSFERRAFARPGWSVRCEPALTRKVYWVAPARGRALGERIDRWLQANPSAVQAAQQRWFGERQRLDAATHLIDLLARRLAFMPLVADLKAKQNLPIEDVDREREVLGNVSEHAERLGLPKQPVTSLFALQIELSKAVQQRSREPSSLDLNTQIRPALTDLGARILQALAESRSARLLGDVALSDLELVSPWLTHQERERLLRALHAVAL